MESPFNRLQAKRGDTRSFARFGVSLTLSVWAAAAPEDPFGGDSESAFEAEADLANPREAAIRNLSVSGLCFICDAAYPVGTVIGMCMHLDGAEVPLQAVVRRRSTQVVGSARLYNCGVQFARCPETSRAVPLIAQFLLTMNTNAARAA